MDNTKKRLKPHIPFILYMVLYFTLNAIFLTDFPYMHSDEPWLGALSRSMLLNGDYSLTEPFFDVYTRNPHAIRILFHLLQSGVIRVFGYGLYPLRMISLVFGTGSLVMMYKVGLSLWQKPGKAFFAAFLLSLDVWFLYASHFARQEILLVFVMLSAAALMLGTVKNPVLWKHGAIGVLVGISIGIHPNSFIVALAIGAFYLYLIRKKIFPWKSLWVFVVAVALFALFFVFLSIAMDPNYIQNYIQNGEKFGVNRGFFEKLAAAGDFFGDIWERKGLTYYIPWVRTTMLLFPVVLLFSLRSACKKRKQAGKENAAFLLMGLSGVLAGVVLIGRYNPTSFVFFLPFLYLLLGNMEFGIWKKMGAGFLIFLMVLNLWINLPWYASSYSDYEGQVSQWVTPQDKTLANLNLGFYFDDGKLLDYRNLRHFREAGLSFEEYVSSRGIEYILFSNELNVIYEKKPAYDGVYGNPEYYYVEMVAFLADHGELIGSFTNSTYGTHVANWVDQKAWRIFIFKVTAPE